MRPLLYKLKRISKKNKNEYKLFDEKFLKLRLIKMIKISFSSDLLKNNIQISIAAMEITDFDIISDTYDLDQIISEVKSELKSKYTINNIKTDPIIAKYRKFYWNQLKIDPTKIRPSSEALIRRILKNQKIPKISSFVDSYNWASAASLIPMGAYDIETFEYPIIIRLTRENEEFIPIGKEAKVLPPNTLIIKVYNIIHLMT